MKKFFLLTACLGAIGGASFAQQGSWYIGGNAGFSSTQEKTETSSATVDGAKFTSWSFSPEVGTFLTNNLQLGVALNFVGDKREANDLLKSTDRGSMLGGSVYSRYFFNTGAFRPFVGISVTVLPGSMISSATGAADYKTNTLDLGANLNAGFTLALSPVVTAIGSFGAVGFNQSTSEVDGSNVKHTSTTIGFKDAGTLGQRFNVGIYYTFSR